jgi:peptidoglycan/LPS O-acetylase OafA/YrhL
VAAAARYTSGDAVTISGARRSGFGRGLIILGVIGMALNSIFLCLDWISFDDRSSTKSVLLAVSILGVILGGWLLQSSRIVVAAILAGVFLGSLFLFAAAFFAWLKSGYFFPARSRLLLRTSLAALVISGVLMAWGALRRRRTNP